MGEDKSVYAFGDDDKWGLEFDIYTDDRLPDPKPIDALIPEINYRCEKSIDGTSHHYLT